MTTPPKHVRWYFYGALSVFALFAAWAAAPSTETVISLTTGLKIGGKATDRIGFYNATPTPKPVLAVGYDAAAIEAALAAQGLLSTATPTPTP